MKKITIFASAVALAAMSASAGAWWGGPCVPHGMTPDQQQAMEKEMTDRRTKGWPPAVDPMSMGFPGNMGPWGDMGSFGPMGPWNDMAGPGYPTMPAFPEPPDMPTMPDPYGMDMPQPPVPTFMKDRYKELEAYRDKMMKESKARRDKMMEDMKRRRKNPEAGRFHSAHPFKSPHKGMPVPSEPHPPKSQQTEAVVKAPARVPETEIATPAPETKPIQAPAATPASPPAAAPTAPTEPAVPTPPAAPANQAEPAAPAPAPTETEEDTTPQD